MKSWLRPEGGESTAVQTHDFQSKRRHSNVDVTSRSSSDSVGLLNGHVKRAHRGQYGWLQKPAEYLQWKTRRFWAILGATLLLLVLLFSAASTKPETLQTAYDAITKPSAASDVQVDDRNFYILIPKSHVDLSTCRTVLTASALDYPTTWLIDWDENLDTADKTRQRNFEHLTQVRQYLRDLGSRRDNDTVLILDEPNSWFQVRPEVLLQRYIAINNRANEKLEKMFGGSDNVEALGIRQNIVFTASKHCASNFTGTPTCLSVPQAPEPLTARYLGSGIQIGSVKEMRALYEYACERGEDSKAWNSITSLMTIIFAEQETQRKGFVEEDLPSLVADHKASGKQLPREFSIGLDYEGILSYPTAASTNDLSFLRHDGHGSAADSASLAPDVLDSTPPYWTPMGDGAGSQPDNTSWAAVALLTNAHAHTVPAIVHFDAAPARNRWDQLWLAPHARNLLDRCALRPDMPVAIVADPRAGAELRFWAPSWSKPGIKSMNQDFNAWEDVCGSKEDAEAIFSDGLGPWKNPQN